MPIKESSFRIGCGRYLQEENLLARCGTEILRYGRRPLIVGDEPWIIAVCSLPGSSIHGIFRARVLEWGAIAFSKLEMPVSFN